MAAYFILISLLCMSSLTSVCAYDFPFQDPTLPWEKRLDDLVDRLTLEEIPPQTLASYNGQHTPAIPRLGIKEYVWITECLAGEVTVNSTAFPQPIGVAAAFSEELNFNISQATSYEVRARWNFNRAQGVYAHHAGLSCFSPVINIMRHPLWGRNQETYGEDPFLSGKLAQNFVRGLQGSDPRYITANAGCKHFDVHGGPENIPTSRFSFNAKVSTRDWRMTFLPQFKMCVEAGTYSLMCSYNSINGIPACANQNLLTNITRNEWGFKGYIISDDMAIEYIDTHHGYTKNPVDTITAAIKAGTNMELGTKSGYYLQQIAALNQSKLTEKEIRDNVRPLMYTRLRLGEFDPEDMVPYNKITMDVVQSDAHREQAIRAAYMSFTLLKNEGRVLPIMKQYSRISVVGPFANSSSQLFGTYSASVNPKFTTTVLQGLSKLNADTAFASGCSSPACKDYSSDAIRTAVAGSELIFVALGNGQSLEAEGKDRAYLDLHGQQLQLLQDAVFYGKGAPVVLLVFTAGPLDLTWAKINPGVVAILYCGYSAQSTGEALYRSLTLSDPLASPAGRLPATWPVNLNQIPSITDYTMEGRTYRYYKGDPLYPFGYGLSYSSFEYTKVSVSPVSVEVGNDATVEVCLKNTGKFASDEVVQVYMSWPQASIPLPKWQLVAFSRQHLSSGALTCVKSLIAASQMQVWLSDEVGFGYIPGVMTLYAGGQQPGQRTAAPSNILSAQFQVKSKDEKLRYKPLKKENNVDDEFNQLYF